MLNYEVDKIVQLKLTIRRRHLPPPTVCRPDHAENDVYNYFFQYIFYL